VRRVLLAELAAGGLEAAGAALEGLGPADGPAGLGRLGGGGGFDGLGGLVDHLELV